MWSNRVVLKETSWSSDSWHLQISSRSLRHTSNVAGWWQSLCFLKIVCLFELFATKLCTKKIGFHQNRACICFVHTLYQLITHAGTGCWWAYWQDWSCFCNSCRSWRDLFGVISYLNSIIIVLGTEGLVFCGVRDVLFLPFLLFWEPNKDVIGWKTASSKILNSKKPMLIKFIDEENRH